MDILTERVKTVYFKYLRAAFGSALISSIYGVVDMAMVGQYHGSDGTAALAIAPAIIRRYALSFLLLPFNIFSTLFSGHYEALGLVHRVRCPRACGKRHSDPAAALRFRRRLDLVCHAADRARCHAVRRRGNEEIHGSAARGVISQSIPYLLIEKAPET